MNKYSGMLSVTVVICTVWFTRTAKEAKAKRRVVLTNNIKDVDAINRATSVILDRIHRGMYSGLTIPELEQEFQFEQMTQHSDVRDLSNL